MGPDWAARLARAEEAFERLQAALQKHPRARSYAADRDARDIVERNIQVAVEAFVDMADRIVERRRWGRPETATEAVAALVHRGALPKSSLATLQQWVRLRNVLVHEYAHINSLKVHAALKSNLSVLRDAVARLAKHVEG